MTDDYIAKLVATANSILEDSGPQWESNAADIIQEMIQALEAEHQRAETEHYQKNRARNERNTLHTVVWPVLDAWNDEGINPTYHRSMKRRLSVEWWTLWRALENLSRAIDAEEKP